ncbi:hypothetical protein TNCV_1301001 [Trichonephila clavipes]|nr:hypothetical protein TNCV_1301001 [Trichonephila clavipes]
MKKFDQTLYKLPPPTPIHVPAEKRPLEEKSLPFSNKRSKVRITPVMRRVSSQSELPMAPVQIPQPPAVTSPRTTCADFSVTSPRTICADSSVISPRATFANSKCSRTCADSSVKSPTVTCADSTCADSTCADSRCSRTCADSNIPCPTATYAESSCIRTCADSSVSSPTVTCADSIVTSPTTTYASSPRARYFGPFGADRCIRPAHVVCIWTPRTPASSHGTLYF